MYSEQPKQMIEIIWHGRGGQGVVTASNVLVLSLVNSLYIQSSPEFGPERMGAPVEASTRISNKPINLHCAIESPDYVMVLDSTLLKSEEKVEKIYKFLKPGGFVFINSPHKIEWPYTYTFDVGGIAEKYLEKRDKCNIATIGALKKVLDELSLFPELSFESLEQIIRRNFPEDKNPGVAEKNINVMKEVYNAMKIDS